MKTLVYSILFVTLTWNAAGQTINALNSTPMSTYHVINEDLSLDHSGVGENVTWNFDALSISGSSLDSYASPSSAELSLYPETTSVLTISSTVGSTIGTNHIFTKDASGTLSITGIETTALTLNYSTDDAVIGAFPLAYGYANTDAIAGTYAYTTDTTYSGTFSGTIATSVDAYGTLTTNDLGAGGYSGTVTRLKTVQNFSLTYIMPNAGTATQTAYYYYDNSTGELVLRTTTINVIVAALSIDQTTVTIESRVNDGLAVPEYSDTSNMLLISTNPVKEVLRFHSQGKLVVNKVLLSDSFGKEILVVKGDDAIAVAQLQKGLYIAIFDTNLGIVSRKFIKE